MISPLSQAQLSIYLACQWLTETGGNYQLASLFKLPDSVDLTRLKQALEAVQLAHPYMLSRLTLHEGEPCMETPDKEPQVVNWPSTQFTVQVLMRLGFHWTATSAAYLDQMFDNLHSLNYFD